MGTTTEGLAIDEILISELISKSEFFVASKDPKEYLQEIQECVQYIEPTRPRDIAHSNVVREFNEIEKKLFTLMVQKEQLANLYEDKLWQVDQEDLSARYLTKELFKDGKSLGNVHILIDKKSQMSPFLKRKTNLYLKKWRSHLCEVKLYKELLAYSVSLVRTELDYEQRHNEIRYTAGFLLEITKRCLPGRTWVTFAGEWQCV